jgi:sigma-B regulation protein RsbU (phosphoserine phosphatase)
MAVVLLIDNQPLIGESARRMLAPYADIAYHYCSHPASAFDTALEVKPTVVLLDLVMGDVDGLTLIKRFRTTPSTAELPLVVLSAREDAKLKAEAFAAGANDYLVKFPDRAEFVARIRHHSKGFIHMLERDAAHAALDRELAHAAEYAHSLLPRPLRGRIRTNWTLVSCQGLGGDSFGYHWLDDHHFAIYSLDVGGRGVGAALHAARVVHAVRHHGLHECTDFLDPGSVLWALNDAFPMERHRDMFVSAWYGVFDTLDRRLSYASAGHPPAVLRTRAPSESRLLDTPNICAGVFPDTRFAAGDVPVPPDGILYVFSNGVTELGNGAQGQSGLHAFIDLLSAPILHDGAADIERLKSQAQGLARGQFADDLSILRVDFGH